MTNSKWLSALLAGTALTVASTAAFADTSMLTMTRNAAGEGVTFKVSPTADMPASATEVSVKGEIRALLTSKKVDTEDRVTTTNTRARIFVNGKTETSVGVVGANFRINDETGKSAEINQYTGYWEFSPGLTLTAGHTDSIASVVYGADWNGSLNLAAEGAGLSNDSFEQINVAFTSGPVALVVGLEDTSVGTDLAMAASATFSAGDFGVQLAGKSAPVDTAGVDNAYAIGGGIGYSAGAFSVSVGAVTGRGLAGEYSYLGFADAVASAGDDFNAMSIIGTFNITETTSVEAWYGTSKVKDFEGGPDDAKVSGYGGGVFWNPVSQLRLGASAGTANFNTASGLDDGTMVGVGAWFKF
jgi:hypothetical protein